MSALGGRSPPRHTISFAPLRFAHDLASVFAHWALGLGGLAGALGARPAALPHEGIPNNCLLIFIFCRKFGPEKGWETSKFDIRRLNDQFKR